MSNLADPSVREPLYAVLRLRPHLKVECREFDGQTGYVIEDPFRAKFYRVGVAEQAFISLLDGTRTVQDAIASAATRLRERAFSESEALAICRWLLETQLVENTQAFEHSRLINKAETRRDCLWSSLGNPLSIRCPLFNPTAVLCKLEPWLAWTLGRPLFVAWWIVCLYGLALAVGHWDQLVVDTIVLLDRSHWWLLVLSWLVLKLLHETYHALVCRKYGGAVPEAGIFVLFFAPVPYVELTSSWRFASKWQRIATATAGMYIELLLAAVAVIVWSSTGNHTTRHVAVSIAAMASAGTLLVNANPLMRFDGYFILSDLVGIPNLNTHARRWLTSLVERMLGCPPASLGLPPRQTRIVIVYAIAAWLWRTLIYITLLLAIVVLLGRVHVLLAAAAAITLVGGAAYRTCAALIRMSTRQPVMSRRRLALIGCAACVFAVFIAYLLAGPSTIRAPGIVEYKPLVSVRSSSPGFIRQLEVEDGDVVSAGEVLAVLENRELRVQLRMAQLEIDKSVAECRMLRQAGETAKEQAELAAQSALRKKAAELSRQIKSLTIRAPAGGKVVGRNLASWLGRYVEQGTELFSIGDERSKEVVVALQQDDVDLFLQHGDAPIEIRFSAIGAPAIESTVESIEPRARVDPPHEALSSQVGGPLAVRLVDDADTPKASGDYELLDPYFTASVRLSGSQSERLRAGQLATIKFTTWEQTSLRRLQLLLARWYAHQIRN
ncbi:MAG: HlyD family efflux transporter periplasmic adaptor subunit [Pirellulales bacterium]